MYTCASCTVLACANNEPDKMPKNCPMRNTSVMENSRDGYDLPENHDFYINCSSIEGLGYCQWHRLKETIEFCKRMKYHKLGLAFCKGLRKEARFVADLLRAQGFEVVSVICKTGGISKEEVGIPEEVKIHPGEFEAMCNPIAQAKLLNEQQTEFNMRSVCASDMTRCFISIQMQWSRHWWPRIVFWLIIPAVLSTVQRDILKSGWNKTFLHCIIEEDTHVGVVLHAYFCTCS